VLYVAIDDEGFAIGVGKSVGVVKVKLQIQQARGGVAEFFEIWKYRPAAMAERGKRREPR